MGYKEREIWRMTLRKLLALWKDYRSFHGMEKEDATIDDVIPL